ncbi:hypothetical protein HYV30_02595 [Candidatus Kaiserbacteria bacterium]|nr:hypothetical protein [Candidatus Kaiserbacteria bacterium]
MKKFAAQFTLAFAFVIGIAALVAPAPAAAAQECEIRFCWTQGYVAPAGLLAANRVPVRFNLLDDFGNVIGQILVSSVAMSDFLSLYSTFGMPPIEVVTKPVFYRDGTIGAGWVLKPVCLYPAEGPTGSLCGWHEPEPTEPPVPDGKG